MAKQFKVTYINALNDIRETTVFAKDKETAVSIVSDLPLCGQILGVENVETKEKYSSAEEMGNILAFAQLGLHKEVVIRLLRACEVITKKVPYSYVSVLNLVKKHIQVYGVIPNDAETNDKLMQDFVYEIVKTHQLGNNVVDYYA